MNCQKDKEMIQFTIASKRVSYLAIKPAEGGERPVLGNLSHTDERN